MHPHETAVLMFVYRAVVEALRVCPGGGVCSAGSRVRADSFCVSAHRNPGGTARQRRCHSAGSPGHALRYGSSSRLPGLRRRVLHHGRDAGGGRRHAEPAVRLTPLAHCTLRRCWPWETCQPSRMAFCSAGMRSNASVSFRHLAAPLMAATGSASLRSNSAERKQRLP